MFHALARFAGEGRGRERREAVLVVKTEDADVSQQDKWCVPHDVGDVCVCVCVWRMEDVMREVVVVYYEHAMCDDE